MADTLGLDVGGANIKAATAAGDACSVCFPLWRQPSQLPDVLQTLADRFRPQRVALTMTGEICDCFATKSDGVSFIIDSVNDPRSSMALFMITLHNKGVLTGGKNTLITARGAQWENYGETVGKPWENHRKMVISWRFHGDLMGNPWENHKKNRDLWLVNAGYFSARDPGSSVKSYDHCAISHESKWLLCGCCPITAVMVIYQLQVITGYNLLFSLDYTFYKWFFFFNTHNWYFGPKL